MAIGPRQASGPTCTAAESQPSSLEGREVELTRHIPLGQEGQQVKEKEKWLCSLSTLSQNA